MPTESEALTKWCPFVKARDFFEGAGCSGNAHAFVIYDHISRVPMDSRCIGSSCMAWRWKDELVRPATSQGFCGLAGKP